MFLPMEIIKYILILSNDVILSRILCQTINNLLRHYIENHHYFHINYVLSKETKEPHFFNPKNIYLPYADMLSIFQYHKINLKYIKKIKVNWTPSDKYHSKYLLGDLSNREADNIIVNGFSNIINNFEGIVILKMDKYSDLTISIALEKIKLKKLIVISKFYNHIIHYYHNNNKYYDIIKSSTFEIKFYSKKNVKIIDNDNIKHINNINTITIDIGSCVMNFIYRCVLKN